MLAPCLGKFGGIETFCLTLIEDLVKKGASVRLLRKKSVGFSGDNSIEKTEMEIIEKWSSDSFRFSEYLNRGEPQINEAIKDVICSPAQPYGRGVWLARKHGIPCVMTIYNWRRKGFTPACLPGWAARKADRRWYISSLSRDTWESKRKKGSRVFPPFPICPMARLLPGERRGFLFAGRWIPNKDCGSFSRPTIDSPRTPTPGL